MLESRTFHIVFVSPDHGTGLAETAAPDQTVTYAGEAIDVAVP